MREGVEDDSVGDLFRGRDTSVNCMVLPGDRDQFSRMLGQLFQDLD